MKKLLVLLMTVACALCLAFGIAGCKQGDGESSGGSNTQQGETGGTGSDSGEHVHNYGELIPEKLATCTKEGLQAHYYCEGCQKYFNDQKVEKSLSDLTIPALGHILEENQLVCKTCNEQLAESLTFELNSDNTYKLTSGTPTSGGKIMIPKTYNGLPVTSIGYEAFYNCTSLTSITIPDSVTSIGYNAFYGCTNLKGVYITDIAAWCNIDFEDDDSNPLSYAHNLYLNNNLITELTAEMLQGVTKIKDYAFYGCTSLQSITIPERVTSIGNSAFKYCESLESITVSDRNTAYASQDGILYNKDKTKFIHIPQAIKGSITIPNGVTSIGKDAFSGCTGLTSITIPDGVTSIGNSALFGCKRLKSVIIGNGVTSIGYEAFYGCTKLESVTFKNYNGWYRTSSSSATDGTDIKSEDLKNPQTAATYLKSTYKNYYWKRKTA